jgi:hypothetical protein
MGRMSGGDEEDPLAEALRSLELPPSGVRAMVDHIERFCSQHGGERHYGELLALVERCRARQGGRER